MNCPFCGESDFDAIGLKSHLLRYCEEWTKVGRPEPVWVPTCIEELGEC